MKLSQKQKEVITSLVFLAVIVLALVAGYFLGVSFMRLGG